MSLKTIATIEIPGSAGSSFDHGAFDPKTRRVFVAHTGRDTVEVIDHDSRRHIATLPGFPEAAGVVADDGAVLVTNRGAASLAWVDADSLATRARVQNRAATKWRRDRVTAEAWRSPLASAMTAGGSTLQVQGLDGGRQTSLELPGRPRWCVTDAAADAGVSRDPRALHGSCRPAARFERRRALGASLGRRAWPRYRSPARPALCRV